MSEQLSSADGGYELSVPLAAFKLFANCYQDRIFYSVRGVIAYKHALPSTTSSDYAITQITPTLSGQ